MTGILVLFLSSCNDMDKNEPIRFNLHCPDPAKNPVNRIDTGGFTVEIYHLEGEPQNANRIMVARENLEIEILPSKGFSLGKITLNGKPVLWEAPIGLPDPDQLDFSSEEIHIFGKPAPGFEYIKTFVGGIELLGMTNWGMPFEDPQTGEFLPLHGEVSNIPLETVEFEINETGLIARGTIIYRTLKGDSNRVWYERGEEMYRITRALLVDRETPGFNIADTIRNVSGTALVPDWGYHVTFRPEPGSKLLIPSLQVEERWGGEVPEDHETWQPAGDERIRTEIGIIHKELKSVDLAGIPTVKVLKEYPDGRAFELMFPLAPYVQTWYSSGGSDYDEFTYSDGTPVFRKSWNGFGVEIGSSPLDHNWNIDTGVDYRETLAPGESMGILISVRQLDRDEAEPLKREIGQYNKGRR